MSESEKELKENSKKSEEVEVETKKDKKLQNIIEEKDKEIEKLKAESANWKNSYYKAYADTENLRKSIEKDHQEALKYRSEGFLDKLLPLLDGFHMALQMEPNSPETKNYLIGFQYIYRSFEEALTSEGVKDVTPKLGEAFDSRVMHAVDVQESDGPENVIIRVNAKGYMLKDHLIRPALVVVSKKPAPKEEKSQEKEATSETKENENVKKDA